MLLLLLLLLMLLMRMVMVLLLLNDHQRCRRWRKMLFTARNRGMRRSINYDGVGSGRMVERWRMPTWGIAGLASATNGVGYD